MAKKRKIQPVARPFATTSVPKKVAPEEKKEVESKQVSDIVVTQAPVQDPSTHAPEPDDRVESNELQAIVDRLQEKTEKEIGRTLRVVYHAMQLNEDAEMYFRLLNMTAGSPKGYQVLI